jgi:hypothetical protein
VRECDRDGRIVTAVNRQWVFPLPPGQKDKTRKLSVPASCISLKILPVWKSELGIPKRYARCLEPPIRSAPGPWPLKPGSNPMRKSTDRGNARFRPGAPFATPRAKSIWRAKRKRGSSHIRRFNSNPLTVERTAERSQVPHSCPLCGLVTKVPAGLLLHARFKHPEVALIARRGKDWCPGYPSIAEGLAAAANNHKVASVDARPDRPTQS